MDTNPRISGFRYAFLLAALASVIVIRPFIGEPAYGVGVLEVFLFTALTAGAFAAGLRKTKFRLVLGLIVAAISFRVAWQLTNSDALFGLFICLYILSFGIVALSITRSVLRESTLVTRDTIFGAISVYLIIGVIWTMLYVSLELAAPGSFSVQNGNLTDDYKFDRFLGFSFATLTTVGYGNVAPATPRADALSTMEAVLGQIFLAVVIARLVAIRLTSTTTEDG